MLTIWVMGCAAPDSAHDPLPVAPAAFEIGSHSVYLVRHGWHSGLVIRRSDVSAADWPEVTQFSEVKFIEVGWGDAGYLKSRFPNPLVLANAACLPSRSGLHIAGFQQRPEVFFSDSQIIEIKLSSQQLRQLCQFIHNDYARDEQGAPQRLGSALYGTGGIYQSKGYYYLPNTCNVWTARALAAADCPVTVPLCTVAQPLVVQSRRFGQEIHNGATIFPVMYPFVNFNRPTSD